MYLGSEGHSLELSVREVHPAVPGMYPGGDVLVGVRARLGDFSGATTAWVLPEAWKRFLSQLKELEKVRAGEALLESVSPGEMRVRIFALDRAGHVAAEGEVTSFFAAPHQPRAATFVFGAIEFDPTALPALLRELEAAAPTVFG